MLETLILLGRLSIQTELPGIKYYLLPFCQCMVAGWTPETKLTYLQWKLGEFTYISEDEAERLGKQHMLICKREDQNGKTKAG